MAGTQLDTTTDENDPNAMMAAGYCGAKTRNELARGPFCRQVAGTRTDHPGTGRCWLHGGRNRLTTGRTSSIKTESLKALIAEQEEDPEIFDTRTEIATTRALFIDFINRYEDFNEKLTAWYESYQPEYPNDMVLSCVQKWVDQYEAEHDLSQRAADHTYKVIRSWLTINLAANPRPRQILDISDAYKMLSEVTKMVERVGKMNSQNAISRKDFVRIMTEIGNVIDSCVGDDRTKHRIREKIGSMRLA